MGCGWPLVLSPRDDDTGGKQGKQLTCFRSRGTVRVSSEEAHRLVADGGVLVDVRALYASMTLAAN